MTDYSVINFEHLFTNDIDFEIQLAHWFDLFFLMKQTKETHAKAVAMNDLAVWKNTEAMIINLGLGGGKYSRFIDFNKP